MAVVFAVDSRCPEKLNGEVIGVGRRRQEERKFYFTTRGISQTKSSSTVVLMCFAYGVDTYI
jgi:hypothetical protein